MAVRPTSGAVGQKYGANPTYYAQFGLPGHEGEDYPVPVGTQVVSVLPGVVSWVSTNYQNSLYGNKNYGNYIEIDHGNGLRTGYAHLSRMEVVRGQNVSEGQRIGLSGNTGNSTGPHLHFNALQNGRFIDPELIFKGDQVNSAQVQELQNYADLLNGYAVDGLFERIIGRRASAKEMRDYKTFGPGETVRRLRESSEHRNKVNEVYRVLLGRDATDEDYRLRYEQELPEMWSEVAKSPEHQAFMKGK